MKNADEKFSHTDLFFCSMLHAQNLFYIHILYTQKGVYSIFEYKKNFEREAFRFSMYNSFEIKLIKKKIKMFRIANVFIQRFGDYSLHYQETKKSKENNRINS
jgi:hypothetical protein